jgi:hypothetical protein
MSVDFMIQPMEADAIFDIELENAVCPKNAYQCGCNTVQGCACSN